MNKQEIANVYMNLSDLLISLKGFKELIPTGTEHDEFNKFVLFFLSKFEIDLKDISNQLIMWR